LRLLRKSKENCLAKDAIPTVLNSKYEIRKEDCKMLNILKEMHRIAGFNSL